MWISPAEFSEPRPGFDRRRSEAAAHRFALIEAARERRRRKRAARSGRAVAGQSQPRPA